MNTSKFTTLALTALLAAAAIGITACTGTRPSPHATEPTTSSTGPTPTPGNVYVADRGNHRVVKLAAGSNGRWRHISPATSPPTPAAERLRQGSVAAAQAVLPRLSSNQGTSVSSSLSTDRPTDTD
jgi:hypothetical protein